VREPFAEAMAETGAQMRALDAELSAPYLTRNALPAATDADAWVAPVADETLGVLVEQDVLATPERDAPLQGDLLASLDPATPPAPHAPHAPPDADPPGVVHP
ncbi:MAG: hypothetical protein QFF03_24925, partial [Pseudomonadota bacterium]|nr:hypothetical protein [Pseudomonadota bacterium]